MYKSLVFSVAHASFKHPSLGRVTPSALPSEQPSSKYKLVDEYEPLFSHWFAVELYNQFNSIIQTKGNIVCLNGIQTTTSHDRTKEIYKQLQNIANLSSSPLFRDRGITCNQPLKTVELTHTALYARAMDRFLFSESEGP